MNRFFYSIPIYNLNSDEYYKRYNAKKEKYLKNNGLNINKDIMLKFSVRYDDMHLKPWIDHDIYGWIRLFTVNTQLRAEIFSTVNERDGHKIKPRIEDNFYSPIIYESGENLKSYKIRTIIVENLKELTNDVLIANKFVDFSEFESISKHIDWNSLLLEQQENYMKRLK